MVIIQKATIEDVPEIKKLLFATWTFAYKDILTLDEIKKITSKWHSPEVLSKEINNPQNVFFIAKIGEKIVGQCNAESRESGKTVYIERIHVLPDYHRQGIGKKLMEEVLSYCPEAQSVILEVEKDNERAYLFYKKLGFQKVGDKQFIVDDIQMKCDVLEKILKKEK